MRNGSKSIWLCPDIIIGTILLKREGIDKNFAIHFPWIDKIFGTYYYPDEWPESYGLDGEEIAPGFLGQTIEPFTEKKKNALKT